MLLQFRYADKPEQLAAKAVQQASDMCSLLTQREKAADPF